MDRFISIAIDGPSGVGKSTIARKLASELQYVYIDTGAMFRTLSVYFLDHGYAPENEQEICGALDDIDIRLEYIGGIQHMILNGTDVTDRLRTEEVSHMASVTSQYQRVRTRLLEMQRALADTANVIMDGRDIGTVVLPNAKLKIFLTAEPSVRALRRYRELEAAGKLQGASLEDIEKDIRERDYRDSHREIAPLKPASDAVTVDTSQLTIEEVGQRILEALHERETC